MKLIDLLIQELPKRGGWPDGSDVVATNGRGAVYGYKTKGCISGKELGIHSSEDGHVTKEQYEAALVAAQEPAWNGEGLPPVGSLVEVTAEDFEGGWHAIEVVYVHNGEVVGIVKSDNEHLNDRLEKFSAGYNRAEFRPISSEEDKKRDDAIDKLTDAICGEVPDTGMATAAMFAVRAYDAISAGKIPGVRVE